MIHVICRSNQPLLLARESDKDQRVMAWPRAQGIKQRGQQNRARPVVDHAVATFDLIGMRADHDNLLRLTRQHANDIRRKLALERLLGEIRVRRSWLKTTSGGPRQLRASASGSESAPQFASEFEPESEPKTSRHK